MLQSYEGYLFVSVSNRPLCGVWPSNRQSNGIVSGVVGGAVHFSRTKILSPLLPHDVWSSLV
jgi:hypothetical protein